MKAYILSFLLSSIFFQINADTISNNDSEIIVQKCPETILFFTKEKIYLNTDFLSFHNNSLFLETPVSSILLNSINSDENGCYVAMEHFHPHPPVVYHGECYNCGFEWFTDSPLARCPKVNCRSVNISHHPMD